MEEKILMQGVCNPLSAKGFATKNGKGVLTNKRFIFCKHSLPKTLVMGALVNLTEGDYEYSIPVEDIAKAEVKRHMLGHALFITTKDGDTKGYGIANATQWQIAIDNALQG